MEPKKVANVSYALRKASTVPFRAGCNAASHAITEGMRVDLQSSRHDNARMFHHFEIELMLTVYNGLVKASFGKHHDSDPTNSRRTDETYEGTLLPLIGQLTYPDLP